MYHEACQTPLLKYVAIKKLTGEDSKFSNHLSEIVPEAVNEFGATCHLVSTICLISRINMFKSRSEHTQSTPLDPNFTNAVSLCAYSACTIPDLLQLQKFSAISCGVKNDRSRLNDVLNMDYVVPPLTALFVAGRIAARFRLHVGLGADDWTVLAASAAYFAAVGTSLGLVLNDFGLHTYHLSVEQVIAGKKFFYAVQLFYMISITLIKLALLLFFLRIFTDHKLRQAIWITGLFILSSNLSIFLALAFQCTPFEAYWTNWLHKEDTKTCINTFAALEAAAVFSILHHVMILVLPIPTVWRLDLVWKKKANLLIMFSVGSIALICSFLRLPPLIRLHHSKDLSYDQAPVILYSHLEQSVGIICACLPACRSLLEHFFPSMKMNFGESDNPTPGTQAKRSQSAKPSRSQLEKTESTRSLVELSELPVRKGNGKDRSSTTNLTVNDETGRGRGEDKDLGVSATAETRPRTGPASRTDYRVTYTKKWVEMNAYKT
ncbi:hypothetical protein VTL71DRAFT_438 [Oculimacula yallundae]|uniref:Rhodopsin domain-containing protein n=1 Tax=Oculimacula yallundae TaxID=86028 RepID=A0ABR4D067_9HELO